MESREKQIIIDTTIIDNFIAAAKNVAKYRQELKGAQKEGDKYKGNINDVAVNLAKANNGISNFWLNGQKVGCGLCNRLK